MGTGDLDDNEEAEVLIEMYQDSKLISKLLNYYPTERPSEEEEESEIRAIETWKKKNGIFTETTMSDQSAVNENIRLGKIQAEKARRTWVPNSLKEQARLIRQEKETRKEEKKERQRLKTEAIQQRINEENNLTSHQQSQI